MQTRRFSFLESLVNVGIGYGVAVLTQVVVFPLFGIRVPLRDNLVIGAVFTVISVVRSYTVRRVFNGIHNNPSQ